jgi:membrane dipeptidase
MNGIKFSRHNDLPWNIRKFLKNQLREFRFGEDLRSISPWSTSAWSHTDLRRLKEGMVSAQVSSFFLITFTLSKIAT